MRFRASTNGPGEAPVSVSDETFAVVKAGVDVSRWSDGAFDLSWAALRGMYDFRPGHHRIPKAAEIRRRLPLIRWQDIGLDETAHTVFLRRTGMAIGTGSIAKGYALDRGGRDPSPGRIGELHALRRRPSAGPRHQGPSAVAGRDSASAKARLFCLF